MSVRVIRQGDPEYPRRLHLVERPPEILYAEGDLGLLERPRVAIIGSRHPSPYGIKMAYEAAGTLARQGVVVVSGMAIGLDARAHRGALDAGGGTVAVLGCGIDLDLPMQNRQLLKQVRQRGLVLSEYEPGLMPQPFMFPKRNRIIAAISQALLVVEGKASGGTSNTADWAQKLGMKPWAIPGQLDNPLATGPNYLIRDGAHIYTHPNGILLELGLPTLPEQDADEAAARQARIEQAEQARIELTGAEATLYDLILPTPQHVDALAARSALDTGLLLAALSSLELQGLITQLPGKHFALAS